MFGDKSNIPYSNIHGVLEAIQPLEKVELETKIGPLVPVYKVEDQGRMKLTPVKIDTTGKIKSLQLQEATMIKTSIGDISVEFLTFYPSGNIRRLFPLNGKLSGFWSEENEYDLAKAVKIPTSIGIIKVKPIYIHFYDSGELKSITFWPKERVEINTPYGLIKIKTGISFYKNGSVKSFEPDSPIVVNTPIGAIEAFDPDPMGINGEKNSLSFNEDGQVLTISTIKSEILVQSELAENKLFTPDVQRSRCNDELFVVTPLKIEFNKSDVIFKHGFKTIGHAPNKSDFVISDFICQEQTVCLSSCH